MSLEFRSRSFGWTCPRLEAFCYPMVKVIEISPKSSKSSSIFSRKAVLHYRCGTFLWSFSRFFRHKSVVRWVVSVSNNNPGDGADQVFSAWWWLHRRRLYWAVYHSIRMLAKRSVFKRAKFLHWLTLVGLKCMAASMCNNRKALHAYERVPKTNELL